MLQLQIAALEAENARLREMARAYGATVNGTFTLAELKCLRRLVHPDKHDQSAASNSMAQRVAQLIRESERS